MEENLKQEDTGILKFALFGPESTGKTTLAKQLASYYHTEWVPEFARDYLQEKWEENQHICVEGDMMPIAYGQTQLENEKLALADTYLFCDTNLMVTKVFSEMYYGVCDPLLDQAAQEHQYDLFFLTDIDVPWEKDDIRDSPKERESVFSVFKEALIATGKPFITLSGNKELRLAKAVEIINNLSLAKTLGFSSADFVQIYEHGIPFEKIQQQLAILKKGIDKSHLIRPATVSNGILSLTEADFQSKATLFEDRKSVLKLKKFVPASGAATRMFKVLNEFVNEFDIQKESINAYINRKKENKLSLFIIGMDKFPFFKAVDQKLRQLYPDFEFLSSDYKNYYFIKTLLAPDHFDFANKPKAVLPFHQYKTHIANPIEEHLHECAYYASSNSVSNLHFTVTEIHQKQFEQCVAAVIEKFEQESGTKINISYSYQSKSTDSISLDLEHKPARTAAGKLIFRPGGHGALIENLNELDADVIFIKNIDNVIQNHIEEIALYKKALAGILIAIQNSVFTYLNAIESQQMTPEKLVEAVLFVKQNLNVTMESDGEGLPFEDKMNRLKEVLDRPIRVCGMVKNEGEPGGGPFWVQDKNGTMSLQIVESSQVNTADKSQKKILANATHFNPVDLVCGIKNYKNEKFDLTNFVDHHSGFIVEKSTNSQVVQSYELPGLWNGAMANWLTVFVEVPILTFNPVKTVNDLLKPAHQPQ